MGKSTAQSLLTPRGIPVTDTDHIARALVEPGQPAQAEIRAQFGEEFLRLDGTLRRAELAKLVFADPGARKRLESILHPRIRSFWLAEVEHWRGTDARVGVVVIPLLFETEARSFFDTTVCVACGAAVQRERLRARGWTEAEIQLRCAAQWPVERKIGAADHLVWTDGVMAVHSKQWDRILGSV